MTRYLLDANVFIRAKRDHYRFSVFPCFWDWLAAKNGSGLIASVAAVERELQAGNDDLAAWAAQLPTGTFRPPDQATTVSAAVVTSWVKDPARPYKDSAINTFFASADYWLIAHAHAHAVIVVTHEMPEPLSQRRIKIPDVCNGIGVEWINPFEMMQREGAAFR